jgi:hypothetical protein
MFAHKSLFNRNNASDNLLVVVLVREKITAHCHQVCIRDSVGNACEKRMLIR